MLTIGLSIALIGFAMIGTVLGILRLVLRLSYSWGKTQNKNNYTGVDVAEKIFDKFQDKIKVKTSFWSVTYVYYQKKTKTLRLGRIDSRRKSLWTMATVGRQAYAAHILEQGNSNNEKPRVAKIWIRLQTFWVNQIIEWFLFIFSTILTIVGIFLALISPLLSLIPFFLITFVTGLLALLYAFASFKTSKMLIEDADLIFKGIIDEEEITQIKKLWKVNYLISIIDLIESIFLVLIIILDSFESIFKSMFSFNKIDIDFN